MTTSPNWSDEAIEHIAHRFKLLAEPSRLRLLLALRDGERTVGELVEITQMPQANVSQQLLLLAHGGLVVRRKVRQRVWYRLVDSSLISINHLVCQSLYRQGVLVLDSLSTERPLFDHDRVGGV